MGLVGACLVGLPARAARLQGWDFDASHNRLTFTTEGRVEPQAQLLSNPRRLVVDLPGIAYDQAQASRMVGGAVESVQVMRADAHTTRLVLALNQDYVVHPGQIRVWGVTQQQWIVQLPDPASATTKAEGAVQPLTPVDLPPRLSRNQVSYIPVGPTATVIQDILTTPNGFFLQTQGSQPHLQVYRTQATNGERQIVVDVLNAAVVPTLIPEALPSDRYGVRRWSVTQFRTSPPAVRISLALDSHSPDWQITPLRQGGVVLMPVGVQASAIPTPQPTVALPVIATTPPAPVRSPASSPTAVPSPTVVAQTSSVAPQRQWVVMLDPGHGGRDPGAVGIDGLQEKGVVLAVSQRVAAVLQQAGVTVVLTRQGDQTVDLQPRVDQAEAAAASLFVSIHANAVEHQRSEVNGLETYYFSEPGQRLATQLHERVLSQVDMGDRGVRQARFYVLRRTSMPAALIEIGFVTGAVDAPKLRNPAWQAQMGDAIAAGILDYVRGLEN